MSTKRTKIRPPRRPATAVIDFDKSWSCLSSAMADIRQERVSQLSFELLYRTTYQLVSARCTQQLYDAIKADTSAYLKDCILPQLRPWVEACSQGSSNDKTVNTKLIQVISEIWTKYTRSSKLIRDIFLYLDRTYTQSSKQISVYDRSLLLFRDEVMRNKDCPVLETIEAVVVQELCRERAYSRAKSNVDKLSTVLWMMEVLPALSIDGYSIQYDELLPKLKPAVHEWNSANCKQLLDEYQSAEIYMKSIDKWIQEDKDTLNYLIDPVKNEIMSVTVSTVLVPMNTALSLPDGFEAWIASENYELFALLYKLLTKEGVDQSDLLAERLAKSVVLAGEQLNEESIVDEKSLGDAREAKKGAKSKTSSNQIGIQWVTRALKIIKRFSNVIEKGFSGDKQLDAVVETTFAKLCNQHPHFPEYVSLYMDDQLKKNPNNKSDEELEDALSQAINLFRYISDKDVFESYYKAHLAKRLLNNRSASEDMERNVISKIKMEVGNAFTRKMEGMFKDIYLSRDLMNSYRDHCAQLDLGDIPSVQINCNVLNPTYWPPSMVPGLLSNNRLPPINYSHKVNESRLAIEKFYSKKHPDRFLTWNPRLGGADVKARYGKRTYDINMPVLTMVILLLFNDVENGKSLSFEQIADSTQIPSSDLRRHLLSVLAPPRTRLLRKVPVSNSINPGDRFFINEKFESPLQRIKILPIAAKADTEIERKDTLQNISETRGFECDAAIVRVLKSRKTVSHTELVTEVTTQLLKRFQPDASLIKKRINNLLDKEYLKRDADDRNIYHYIA